MTQILVRGRSEAGFSLLELLVVLVIIGVALTSVGLSMGVLHNSDDLKTDAQRLLNAFTAAESEARSDGRPIEWRFSDQNWWFERRVRQSGAISHDRADMRLEQFDHDAILQPQQWLSRPVSVRLVAGTLPRFNTEWVGASFQLELSGVGQRVRIIRDAAGRYGIED